MKPVRHRQSPTALELLRAVAGEEMFTAAIPLLRERMKLTPEKLALLLVRVLNPDECIRQGEEASLRGLRHETLKKHKDDKLFPQFVNGK